MTLDDEARLLCDPDQVPVVYAVERHASRRGRSWVIDFFAIRPISHGPTPGILDLRSLATAAGFPPDDDGNVIRAHQTNGDTDHEYRPMWRAMREVVRVWALANNTNPGHLEEIEPRWL